MCDHSFRPTETPAYECDRRRPGDDEASRRSGAWRESGRPFSPDVYRQETKVQKPRPAEEAIGARVRPLQRTKNRAGEVGPDNVPGQVAALFKRTKMNDTVFAFRAEGVIKIIRKLEAATRLAKALEEVLPAMYGIGDKERVEQEALVALATWEEASREEGSWN
jgi:hypothetical protein